MGTPAPVLSLPVALRNVRIIWAALLVSSLLIPVVLYVVSRAQPPQADLPPAGVLSAALGVTSLVLAVLSFVLPERLALAALKAAELEVVEEVDPNVVPGFYREGAPKLQVFASRERAEKVAGASYLTTVIMRSALRESIAMFGAVLLFLTHELPVAGAMVVLAVALLLLAWPREREAVGLLERAYGAKLPEAGGK